MAITYARIQESIKDIFTDLVGEAETNILSSIQGDEFFVSRLVFKCETWLELIARLEAESKAPTTKNAMYPMVALIRNWKLEYSSNSKDPIGKFTIVIVTPSTPTKLSADRESENYVPILRPIASELLQVIRDSYYFAGEYLNSVPHTYIESMHLGSPSDSGNTSYMLPSCVDGIILQDMELTINSLIPVKFAEGPAVTLQYLNNVSELSCASVDGGISVTLDAVNYTNITGLGVAPVYTIYTPHNVTSQSIIVGQTRTILSTGATANQSYLGYIQCADSLTTSRLYFLYMFLDNGNLRAYTISNRYELHDFTITGFEYSDYPFIATMQTVHNYAQIERTGLSMDGGVSVPDTDTYYAPNVADTTELEYTITTNAPTTYRDVIYTVDVLGEQLESISYYKTI